MLKTWNAGAGTTITVVTGRGTAVIGTEIVSSERTTSASPPLPHVVVPSAPSAATTALAATEWMSRTRSVALPAAGR